MSGLVYSLIAPYTHRSGHAIPTGSKTSLRRSRRRGQATGQWPAASAPSAGQSLGSAGRGARRRRLGADRAGSGTAETQSGRGATRLQGVWSTRRSGGTCRRQRGEVSAGSGVIGPASPSACRRIQSPHRPRTSNCSVRGLSRACRTQRRLHGDIEISIVGLQHADRYISVVNTDTAQWSRPDLCLVAGLGVVAVEERALVGSCDRRTAVGRRDYAVIITLLWLGPRAASPRATTGANVHTVGKGAKPTIASTRSGQ